MGRVVVREIASLVPAKEAFCLGVGVERDSPSLFAFYKLLKFWIVRWRGTSWPWRSAGL